MNKLKLFIFLASLVIIYACQSNFDHGEGGSKEKQSIAADHKTESESAPGSKTSEINPKYKDLPDSKKTESEESKTNNELVSQKTVYLTFDDGPTSATTDILDTLNHFNAKATFFMLEPSMRELPEVVNKIAEEGHAVGLHGVTHNLYKFYKTEQSALEEMTTAQQALQSITGIQSNLIRTPYGSVPYLTESYREVLDSNGFKLWDWNVDSSDWSLSNDEYVDTVIGQIEELVNAGVAPIILMHDRANTADHLSTLLTYLSDHGFQTKRIEESTQPYNFNCYQRCHRLSSKE
ncbi:polysaccharide deacetylase family protein [Virgibacillus ndiopensis]|uniref:polysaccharide deacetylase family protein n=1 Tax=Virgibacillus ndiopensis TaxID=2004408 RepID=UPI000C088A9E|nr:polysaccharide deacetylase family protein [Virgibacillus ndiopensis]